ncbi:MAG: chitobiase/beta-hexosaminidase C-terminal domain-containing protein, partial [Kiritimatiellae bacterium]|nr:chitobiase/beta-hexosaminidase C-terminal domain-containing protein [Kiritimatiellia bacterium]
MFNRKVVFAAFLALTLGAGAIDWFDAGISGYTEWPSDGADFPVAGAGTWSGTANAALVRADGQSRLRIMTDGVADALAFGPDVARDIAENLVFRLTVNFCLFLDLPPVDQSVKTAMTALDKGNGQFAYYGLVADDGGGTNRWAELSGATPSDGVDVELEVFMRATADGSAVRYVVDGTPLARNGSEWLPIVVADGSARITEVGYSGRGELLALSGEADGEVAPTVLTIPEISGAELVSVKVGSTEVVQSNGTYTVASGSRVVVTFRPAAGRILSATTMSFRAVGGAMELPVEGRPVSVLASDVLRINEVMASNGDTLGTKNGGAELDWLEIRNDADFDIDLAGWHVGDDPTKKPAKWTRIEGSCVVPAHGFKIVWCDKTYTDWAADEAHSAFGIGKSGGTMFLADAADAAAIRVQMELPPQMKDVSYGLGRREKTVLSKLAPAQCRVPGGVWRDCVGPVGMPGATNGFKVTSYKLDSASAANIPAVEAAIASGSFAPVRTVYADTIAYSNASSSVKTSPEFAQHYRHVSTLGPGVITGSYYAFLCEGVVYVPRAGSWTFNVGSDDGFSLRLYNEKYSFESEFTGGRSYGHTPAIFRIQEPGAYNVRLLYFQGTGAASLDFSVKEGEFEDYESFTLEGFSLVGLPESGVTHAGAWAGHVLHDVTDMMLGRSAALEWKTSFALEDAIAAGDAVKLKVRYADGITASVNGTVVTNIPAAGQRALADALAPAVLDVPSALLVSGSNTVAITAANDAAGSAEFLLSAELVVTKAAEEAVYFREPTPGAANETAGYGPATPKVAFSVPHGYKTEAFSLELSCAEAQSGQIYYTLDGTSPTTSSTPYTGPVTISSTTCIRAAIPQEGAVIQQDAAATYLFLDDVLAQARDVVPAGFPSATINSQVMRYGMDQSVVNGADRERLLRGFTNTVATMSIVIDPHNLFDSVEGIYVNAKACDGRAWERLTMVEQIDPRDAANGFSTAAGIRIRGAFSRGPQYPKHSLRLFFRNDYGDGPLEFPLFGDEGAGKFKKVDLRTSQNYSWANGGDADTFVHEVFSRDSQRDMGDLYTRSRFYNLFINGHYWGVYQTQERGDDDFAETYNGGDADMYDVIKTSQPGYVTGATEGSIDAWEALWDMAVNEGFSGAHSNNYYKAMGLNPDGSRNPEYPVYLNPTNLMDYMLCAHYVVDYDSPAAASKANNLYAVRDRDDNDDGLKSRGFYYLRHDAEHSMGKHANSEYGDDPTLYGTEAKHANFKKIEAFNPAELNYKLLQNDEYRLAFSDRFYKICLAPGGALAEENSLARFRSRMAEIDDVVVCEAARWATKGQTRATWLAACSNVFTFIENRTPHMLRQYRNRGWYPSVAAPAAFDADGVRIADGGQLPDGATVKLMDSESSAAYASGTVYYTLDGSDPRAADGTVAAGASACPAAGF